MTPTLFRHRRELAKHKKTIATIQKEVQEQALVKSQPPQPDAVIHL
jgi:putative membrane protein